MTLDPTDPEAVARAQFVALALSCVGLGAAPATLAAYCDLLATSVEDFGDPRARADEAVASSCALVVRGLWWRAGLRHPILLAPYVEGHAVSDVIEIAGSYGALKSRDAPIGAGDVVIVDGHVLTATRVDGATIYSVDGGQRDAARLEVIAERVRTRTGTTLGGRPILHVVSCVALAAAESVALV